MLKIVKIILLPTVTLTNEITANKHFSLKMPTITSHGTALYFFYFFSGEPYGYDDDYDYITHPSYMYCRETVILQAEVNRTGHIYSPLYGKENYPNELGCYWEIWMPEGWVS